MRVIGGTARGTKLLAVPGDTTRPILDRVKTSLFDILRPRIEGVSWLDIFGGSGAVAIEALSQGAAKATILDIEPKAVETIKKNLTLTHLTEKAEVRLTDCFTYLRNCQKSFDLMYVAPPQYKQLWIEAAQTIAERPHLIADGGQMIIQIDPREYEALALKTFLEFDRRKYVNTELLFFDKLG
jgi:16S rRNA (guanine(966)-N(2))-methyltransferase RsmD